MCDLFDDWDAEDFAFWGGFIETQLEGEQEEKPEEASPDDVFGLDSDEREHDKP